MTEMADTATGRDDVLGDAIAEYSVPDHRSCSNTAFTFKGKAVEIGQVAGN